MAEHTPTPWKATPHGSPQWIIEAPEGKLFAIATTACGNDEANAKFIVQAANSYYPLVEACKKALHYLPDSATEMRSMLKTAIAGTKEG